MSEEEQPLERLELSLSLTKLKEVVEKNSLQISADMPRELPVKENNQTYLNSIFLKLVEESQAISSEQLDDLFEDKRAHFKTRVVKNLRENSPAKLIGRMPYSRDPLSPTPIDPVPLWKTLLRSLKRFRVILLTLFFLTVTLTFTLLLHTADEVPCLLSSTRVLSCSFPGYVHLKLDMAPQFTASQKSDHDLVRWNLPLVLRNGEYSLTFPGVISQNLPKARALYFKITPGEISEDEKTSGFDELKASHSWELEVL